MGDIIIGTEAVTDRVVTRHELQRWYRPVFRNVHMPKSRTPTLRDRTEAAWLWSHRSGIITGLAAAALHGAAWIDDRAEIELIFKFPRAPVGIVARNERIAPDEWQDLAGLPVATPARTAFDLGRFQPDHEALGRLDALMRVRPYSVEDVMMLTKRYKGARGVVQLKALLPIVDGGAQSPQESWWRKFVIDCGLPAPDTQIPVVDERGKPVRILDFGWERYSVALEYDGEHHQANRAQYLKDRHVLPTLRRLGWRVTVVVKEDDPVATVHALTEALRARGWRGTVQIPRYAYFRRHWGETATMQGKFE
ncbi:hypothetical protein [Mycobacterium sp. NAZ190054]|uniref:hypothetical protein n=1 Tax=Mycobacterium sp. NAZ190054 TaxID=1747766 RepID=UPI000795AA7A|nr:hypothetical protein [Mycobacterium sp. NAZ190054]KWX64525.1 hypothetical protein ASJ79_08135 [Mycobacterium sp. NAZ190054]